MKIATLLIPTLTFCSCVALPDHDKMISFETNHPPLKLGPTVPVALRVPHLETIADITTRPPVMIPEGSTNLALGKPVTSSVKPVFGDLALITDGDKRSDEDCFVELGEGRQWIQIDLKKEQKIYAIALWNFHQQIRVYHDVIVQISNDPDFQKNVTTVFNNDHDNTSGLGSGKDKAYIASNKGRVFPVTGVSGRYVRFYSRGNTANSLNHYVEVEIWGT